MQWFAHELDGKRLFAADYDDGAAIVVLEDDAAAMYRVRPPHTVSREALDLGGTTVRTEHELGDDFKTHFVRVRPQTLAGFNELDDVRAELEMRAMRLGH